MLRDGAGLFLEWPATGMSQEEDDDEVKIFVIMFGYFTTNLGHEYDGNYVQRFVGRTTDVKMSRTSESKTMQSHQQGLTPNAAAQGSAYSVVHITKIPPVSPFLCV